MAIANDLRRGNAIKFNGAVCVVMETGYVKPGKGPAYIQAKLRTLPPANPPTTGSTIRERGNRADDHPEAGVQLHGCRGFCVGDPDTYEQENVSAEIMAEVKDFMTENTPLTATYVDGTLAMVELPANVVLTVSDAPEGVKGDSASNVMKPITLETGVVIQAPLFIKTGEKIKVDVKNRKYLERAGE